MSYNHWQSTALWQALTSRDSTDGRGVTHALESCMPKIEGVLISGGTSPKDFTLHDAEHSFRVAEWMVRLLPDGLLQELSSYELALLLLSAYLHDIGMTPEVNKLQRHRNFLLSGRDGILTDKESKEFQRWIDDAGYGVVPPLSSDEGMDEVVAVTDEIITYYTRYQHNDWSEDWIRDHLVETEIGSYTGWLDDLVRLCRSHHEGYDVLIDKAFNPRRTGSPAQMVHLRYLAALLRTADVLDIDPERTPSIIFHHRQISEASRVYWKKDAQVSIELIEGRIYATARPPRAYLHRAVEETLNSIERELMLCRRLDDDTHFDRAAGPGPDLPHKWIINPVVYRDIQPFNEAYEYIDGAFRPDTKRLLELLSGTELYGDKFATVRELLQNAFDAVRELIAYQRLAQPNPASSELGEQLGKLLRVQISVVIENGNLWLVCSDDGIGMTKEIIAYHLLVSGAPIRSQVVELKAL